MITRLLPFLLCLLLAMEAAAQVRRQEVIAMAERYLTLPWQATAAQAWHGKDAEGIQIDTPDVAFKPSFTRPGWWVPGKMNQGVPYQWGGFCTPEEFLAGLKQGRYAGDIYTPAKRQQGDAAVSKHAVGIDCSGLVSRCWRLPRAYSTEELPQLCTQVAWGDLRPGDVLNSRHNHVLLFKGWADAEHARLLAYEAGSPPSWKVLLNRIPVAKLEREGYVPLRFRGIKEY